MADKPLEADWGDTPLGAMSAWSERLRTVIGLVRSSATASCLFWGPEGVMVYNAGWALDLGPLHPQAWGVPVGQISPELAAAFAKALQAAAAGTLPELEEPLLPVMWRSLVDRPSATLSCTPVMGDHGTAEGLLVQLVHVSGAERHNARSGAPVETIRRNAFMLRLSDALRSANDADGVQVLGTRMLGEELGADRASFSEVDLAAGRAWELFEYRRDETAQPHTGTHELGDFGPAIRLLRNGLPIVLDDVRDAVGAPSNDVAAEVLRYAKAPFRAQLTVPIPRGNDLICVMTVRFADAHSWTAAEVATVHVAAIRIWEAVERAWAETNLRLSEARHRALFESIDEGVCLFERLPLRPDGLRDYRYVAMNPAMQRMFGIPDLSGQSIRDNFPDEVEDWYDDYDRVLETGEPIRFERGSETQGRIFAMFVARVEEAGRPMLIAVMQDVTARKRAEAALKESERRFRALVTATSYAVYRMGPDWKEMRQLDGRGFLLDSPEPRTDWLDTYVDPADQPEIMRAIQRAIETKGLFELEHRVKRPDGSFGWTYLRAVPLLDETGEIVEWFGAASDVTNRRQAEEAVRRAELRLRLAQEAAHVATFDWKTVTKEATWSPELLTMLGLHEGELGGTYEDWIATIHPDDRARASREVEWALDTGVLEGEWRVLRPDGEIVWVLVRGVVERDAQNHPQRLTGAQVDITERVLSEAKVRLLVDHLNAQIEDLRKNLGKGK